MRHTAASDTDSKLAALLDAAQREPLFIDRGQKEGAILVSASDYDRLSGKAARELYEFCDTTADRAAASGLTEDKLDELLKHA